MNKFEIEVATNILISEGWHIDTNRDQLVMELEDHDIYVNAGDIGDYREEIWSDREPTNTTENES